MMKMQHSPSLALPLLLTASAAIPASAQVSAQVPAAALAVADAVVQAPRAPASLPAAQPEALNVPEARGAVWEMLAERREEARRLSGRGQWVEAASHWRGVLFDLRQIERFASAPERQSATPRLRALRQEAEHEMKRAQGHLSAFWSVRDMVKTDVDSRNLSPRLASPPLGPPVVAPAVRPALSLAHETRASVSPKEAQAQGKPAPALQFSALMRPPLNNKGSNASPLLRAATVSSMPEAGGPINVSELFTQGLRVGGVERQQSSAAPAMLRWAQAQWWARPMVQRGVDSRNRAALSLLLDKPRVLEPRVLEPSVLPAMSQAYQSAALLKAPAIPTAPTLTPAPTLAVTMLEKISAASKEATSVLRAAPLSARALAPVVAEAARPKSPQPRRSWTMRITLPSAAEAARAAQQPLGSQP